MRAENLVFEIIKILIKKNTNGKSVMSFLSFELQLRRKNNVTKSNIILFNFIPKKHKYIIKRGPFEWKPVVRSVTETQKIFKIIFGENKRGFIITLWLLPSLKVIKNKNI